MVKYALSPTLGATYLLFFWPPILAPGYPGVVRGGPGGPPTYPPIIRRAKSGRGAGGVLPTYYRGGTLLTSGHV